MLGTALGPGSANTILALRDAGPARLRTISVEPYLSSHSLRRALATSVDRADANVLDMQRQGGWHHDGTVQHYIEEAGRFEENGVGSLLRTQVKRT